MNKRLNRIPICGATLALILSISSCNKAGAPVGDVSLDISEITMLEGKTLDITATVDPTDADIVSVVWTSSDEGVVEVVPIANTGKKKSSRTVSLKASMKGNNPGECTINCDVMGRDGSMAEAICRIKVVSNNPKVTAIALNVEKAVLKSGEKIQLLAALEPSEVPDDDVQWTSSAPSIAKVSDSGLVTAVAAGNAKITAKSKSSGLTAVCNVIVN